MLIQTRRTDFAQLILRLALGIGFLLPVLDRLGILGPPGSKSVSWGNWPAFVAYTHQLIPFMSAGIIPAFALFATIAEIVFSICLITGYYVKAAATGAAILTTGFGLCMALFTGIASPFIYPVFVFAGAALLLSTLSRYRWSVDDYVMKRKSRP